MPICKQCREEETMVPGNEQGTVKCRQCGKLCESTWYDVCWECSVQLNKCQMKGCGRPVDDVPPPLL